MKLLALACVPGGMVVRALARSERLDVWPLRSSVPKGWWVRSYPLPHLERATDPAAATQPPLGRALLLREKVEEFVLASHATTSGGRPTAHMNIALRSGLPETAKFVR